MHWPGKRWPDRSSSVPRVCVPRVCPQPPSRRAEEVTGRPHGSVPAMFPAGLLHHSDRGVPYACQDYVRALGATRLVCSMSRRSNCYDNAAMESFWSTLKTETGLDESVPISRRATKLIASSSITSRPSTTRRGPTARWVASHLWPTKTTLRKTTARSPDPSIHFSDAS